MKTVSIEDLDAKRPSRAWITRSGGAVVEVSGPQVYNDTLVGYVSGQFEEMPVSGVRQVVVRERDKAKTIALLAAGAAAGTVLAMLITGKDPHEDPCQFVDISDGETDPRCPQA
jgi:hypothetical protein